MRLNRFFCHLFATSLTLGLLHAAHGEKQKIPLIKEEHEIKLAPETCKTKDGYTINFNNVSVIEYIRFVSKISKLNFLFDQQELDFAVTVVAEEPISTENILSALMQTLRIHGLTVLEQENNLLITKSKEVSQMSRLVTDQMEKKGACHSPIVTRVFRIKQANPTTLVSIIRPLISSSALIEVSPETRQLILTDIVTNVDKISNLLLILDTPHSNLEMDSYTARHISPTELVTLATQILVPFAEGFPLVLVPQLDSNTVFVVSVPHLLERAMTVVEDLDVPPQNRIAPQAAENIFIYKTQSRTPHDLQASLKKTAHEMASNGSAPPRLIEALNSATPIQESSSLFFVADSDTIGKIKEILAIIDIADAGPHSFFLYKLKFAQGDFIQNYLRQVASNLQSSENASISPLVQAIRDIKWIKESNALLLTGPATLVDRIKQMIAEVDMQGPLPTLLTEKTSFFLYEPKNRAAPDMQVALQEIVSDLQTSGLVDPNLLASLSNARFVPSANSFLFTGTSTSLDKVKELLATIDVPHTASTALSGPIRINPTTGEPLPSQGNGIEAYQLYAVKHAAGKQLIETLQEFAQNLQQSGLSNQALYDTLCRLQWIEKNNTVLVTGDTNSINQALTLLQQFDVAEGASAGSQLSTLDNTNFLVYKLQYHPGEELKTVLKQVVADLATANPQNIQGLLDAVNSLQWIRMTNSLLATGKPPVLAKLRDLIRNLDIPLRQVFIEVLVIDTTLTNSQDFGVQWGSKGQYFNKLAIGTGNFPTNNPITQAAPNTTFQNNVGGNSTSPFTPTGVNATTTPTGTMIPFMQGFDLGVIGDIIMHKGKSFLSLSSLINALQTDVDSTIVLNPKIIAQDNNNSTIFVGDNQPYVGSLVQNFTTGSSSTSSTTSLEYRDIGINLSITPVLGDGDLVTLTITTDISQVINATQLSTSSVSGITTSHTNLNTKVTVPNDHFLVLSGLIRDTKTHFKSGIPCLGGLPVVGLAFSENQRVDDKRNVLIFLRPHIITNFEEYKKETAHQENLYRETVVLPVLKEEFDSGLDFVKRPEDELLE